MAKRKLKSRVVKKQKTHSKSKGINKLFLFAAAVIIGTLSLVFIARQYGTGPFAGWAAETIGINQINVDADDGTLVAVMPSINAVGNTCMQDCLKKGTPASTCGSRCAAKADIANRGTTPSEITDIKCPAGKKLNNKKTACIDKNADGNTGPTVPTKAQCESLNKAGSNGWILDTNTGKCTQISSAPVVVEPPKEQDAEKKVKCTGDKGITFASGDTVVGPVITVNNEKKDSVYECTGDGNWKIKSTCGADGKQPCTLQDNPDTVTVKPTYQIVKEASETGGKPDYNCKKDGTIYSSGTYVGSANEVCSSGSWVSPDEYYKKKADECNGTTGMRWDAAAKACNPIKGDVGTIVSNPDQCKSGKVQYVANGVLKCIENAACKAGCTGSSNRTCNGNILRVTTCTNGCNSAGTGCNTVSGQKPSERIQYASSNCDGKCPGFCVQTYDIFDKKPNGSFCYNTTVTEPPTVTDSQQTPQSGQQVSKTGECSTLVCDSVFKNEQKYPIAGNSNICECRPLPESAPAEDKPKELEPVNPNGKYEGGEVTTDRYQCKWGWEPITQTCFTKDEYSNTVTGTYSDAATPAGPASRGTKIPGELCGINMNSQCSTGRCNYSFSKGGWFCATPNNVIPDLVTSDAVAEVDRFVDNSGKNPPGQPCRDWLLGIYGNNCSSGFCRLSNEKGKRGEYCTDGSGQVPPGEAQYQYLPQGSVTTDPTACKYSYIYSNNAHQYTCISEEDAKALRSR